MTAVDERAVLTPTALNRLVRQLLDDTMPPIWVEGELSNLAKPSSGHLYFTLKDSGAQIRCAMFRARAQGLRFRPGDGLLVRVRGKISLYEPRGDYQLIVERMEEAGEGALQRAFEELKHRLAAEGLLDAERKRPLPAFPTRLAVITSPSGAAVRDVLSVLQRRFPLLPVEILPSPVQGAEAVPVLRQRLRQAIASGRYDVILLTRGGGSLEDLWPFNDEQLARDIAASPVPIVAAIGHEVDITLAELAADLRAPTPSAAAEALSPEARELERRLARLGQQLHRQQRRELERFGQRLDSARLRLQNLAPQRRLALMRERAAIVGQRLRERIERSLERHRAAVISAGLRLHRYEPGQRLAQLRRQLQADHERLLRASQQYRHDRTQRLRELARALHAVSPLRTLERGYAVLLDHERRVLATAAAVARAGRVDARLADGEIALVVASDPAPQTG